MSNIAYIAVVTGGLAITWDRQLYYSRENSITEGNGKKMW
ncbi:hypothetical protein ABH991_005992 [Bradyrhizobium ottawaense]|jgi:hypothetical protein|uniref:Uncharacterized protein n=1 Tax=Bradyrhizobium ottawaense TaxID=931866 RepID=A0ABV4G6L5_9BRAD